MHRYTDTDTQTQIHRHTDTQTHRHRYTGTQIHKHIKTPLETGNSAVVYERTCAKLFCLPSLF